MKLYVVRHGSTDANLNHLIVGHTDYSLNHQGIQEAHLAKEQMQTIFYDQIICSPLARAKETATIINSQNQPIRIDQRLIERNCGIFEGKKWEHHNFDPYCNFYSNQPLPEGESMQELYARVVAFLEDIKQQNQDIVLVTHHAVCRCIAAYFLGMPEDGDVTIFSHQNGEVKSYQW